VTVKRKVKETDVSFRRYDHISNLDSNIQFRQLLGRKIFWTHKEDGSNIEIYLKGNEPVVSSRNLEVASNDLVTLVKNTEEYPKILELLVENPSFGVYVEACRKGRSITGACVYDKDKLVAFDIFDYNIQCFLPYTLMYQFCYHHNVPVVTLFAETRHVTIKDLVKWRDHILRHCKDVNLEGMVGKTLPRKKYTCSCKYYSYVKFDECPKCKNRDIMMSWEYLQTKVKVDIPIATVKKIASGEPVYPNIPESEVMNAIDKVWQELGTEKFIDKRLAMPLIAKYVSESCKEHLYSNRGVQLFQFYEAYKIRHLV